MVICSVPRGAAIFAGMRGNMPDKEVLFNGLYEATKNSLYHYLHRYSQDEHLLEDLMQQCYLKIWERMDHIRDLDKAYPLVRTIAHHLLVDVVRKHMAEDTVWLASLDAHLENELVAPSRHSPLPLQALDKAIDRLPDPCRSVYLMHREQGMSYREIAVRLSVSVSMVEKHMSKAIRLLKHDLLQDYALVLMLTVSVPLLH